MRPLDYRDGELLLELFAATPRIVDLVSDRAPLVQTGRGGAIKRQATGQHSNQAIGENGMSAGTTCGIRQNQMDRRAQGKGLVGQWRGECQGNERRYGAILKHRDVHQSADEIEPQIFHRVDE